MSVQVAASDLDMERVERLMRELEEELPPLSEDDIRFLRNTFGVLTP